MAVLKGLVKAESVDFIPKGYEIASGLFSTINRAVKKRCGYSLSFKDGRAYYSDDSFGISVEIFVDIPDIANLIQTRDAIFYNPTTLISALTRVYKKFQYVEDVEVDGTGGAGTAKITIEFSDR